MGRGKKQVVGVRSGKRPCGTRVYTELMAAEIPNAEPMWSAYLSLGMDSDGEPERVFAALFDGGHVLMAMQETFFASRFWSGAGPVRHQLDDPA